MQRSIRLELSNRPQLEDTVSFAVAGKANHGKASRKCFLKLGSIR